MITKIISVKGGEFAVSESGHIRPVETNFGLSVDAKPVVGVENADRFYEMDTKRMYLYDADGKEWLPL